MLLNNPMISTTHSILTNSKTGKNPDPKNPGSFNIC